MNRLFILFALCVYTAFNLNQTWPTHWIFASTSAILILLINIGWLFLYRIKPHLLENIGFKTAAWIGSWMMGVWATFTLLSIPVTIGFLIQYIISFFVHPSFLHPETMQFLFAKINLFLIFLSYFISAYGFIEVLRGPKVKEISIDLPNIHDSLYNLRIAQISDLHIGPTIRKNYVKKVVALTNASNPDLIVVTGDLVDARVEFIEEYLQPLASLKARLGVYYVTGNHEYYWNAESLINKVKQLGWIPLINENVIIDFKESKTLIAGITDHIGGHFIAGHQPDIDKASYTTEETHLKILLSHRPDACFAAEKLGFDLQLSGHTHAGQFFPFNLLCL